MRDVLAPPRERGHLEIRPRVVDTVGRRAARGVPGVVRDSVGRIARHDLPGVSSRVEGGHVRLDVDLAVAWGRPLAAVSAAVQREVANRVRELTGLVVDAVDVTVESVVVPPEQSERGRVT
ncbi:Asp23/Gls24 family envelope stress response protein [Jannaschia sp. R86511]|uniref:Asp23/Gls24 family envelope stress response protein n=1 Tax=Jannaschia sp. R86511 TaxID=3093853 RepID=UPI0036D389BE